MCYKNNSFKYQLSSKINPITIVGLILFFSVTLTIGGQEEYLIALMFSLLCLSVFSIRNTLKSVITLLVIFGTMYLIKPYLGNVFLGSIYTMLIIVLKYSPIIILGKVMSCFSSSYLMAALNKVGIKGTINVGVTIFFRFLPEIFLRVKEIHNGLKIRDFKLSIAHPVRSFELYFVPLLYKCIHVSDTLTCSIISKGKEFDCKKTNFHEIHFSLVDIVISVAGFILLGVSI